MGIGILDPWPQWFNKLYNRFFAPKDVHHWYVQVREGSDEPFRSKLDCRVGPYMDEISAERMEDFINQHLDHRLYFTCIVKETP